jgi:hypothetical protein
MKELSEDLIFHIRVLFEKGYSDLINWKSFKNYSLTEEFIDEFGYYLDWYNISRNYITNGSLSDKIIQKYINEIDWNKVSAAKDITEEFILKYQDRIDFYDFLSYSENLTENIIRKFADKMSWRALSLNHNFSKNLIIDYVERIDFNILMRNEKISQDIKDYCRMFI